jgi:outer membrane receptor protein involved in Fe transport
MPRAWTFLVLSAVVLPTYTTAARAQGVSPDAPAAQSAAAPPAQSAATPPVQTVTPPPPSDAQQSAPAEAQPTTEAAPRKNLEEEVIVTGTRVRRKDLKTPAPVTVISHEQIEQSGKMTIGDFLQMLPEQGNAPNFQLNTGGINYGADGTTRINLRSLGVERTLVLINGRRVVPSGLGASAAVDLNTIPSAVVERIEVLKDGASALYGSDAVAGVVNIITRRNYNGTEVAAESGVSGHGDAQTFDAHVTTGRSDEHTSAMFSVRYFNQKSSLLGDRSWAQQALDFDYTPGGGQSPSGSSRTPQGTVVIPEDPNNLGHPLCNGNALCNAMTATNWKVGQRYIRDPAGPFCGPNGLGQMECFRLFGSKAPANNNTGNDFYNFAAVNYLTIPSTTIQGYSQGDVRYFGMRGYYELSYTQRTSSQNAAPMPLNPADYNNLFVSKDNVYNPFGTDLNFLGRRLVEFGDRTYSEDLGTFRVVTGIEGTFPDAFGPMQGWLWDASMNYGKTSGTFTTGGSFRNSLVGQAVGPSMTINGTPSCVSQAGNAASVIPGCSPLNLLGGPGSIDPSQQNFLGFTGTSRAFDALYTIDVNTSGELVKLAADVPASLALGYEFRRQSGAQIADPIVNSGDSADFNFKSTNGYFIANEAYGELSVPIISNMEGIEALEVDVAGRYVNYSTFGGNFTYKVGGRYTPIRDVTLRGTYSTAFRAPNISELYLGATENDPSATDPCADLSKVSAATAAQCRKTGVTGSGSGDNGLQELTRNGGNPNLKAETAKAYTLGIVFTPRLIPGLSLTVDYYSITIDNAIGTIGASNILQGCYQNLNDQYCSLIVRNNAGTIQYISDVNQNIAQKSTAGIDFSVRYAVPTSIGRFAFAFDGNWLDHFDSTLNLATGTTTIHGKGIYDLGVNPAIKATSTIDYANGGFFTGVLGRYVGAFTECSNPSDPTTAAGGLCTGGTGYNRQVPSYFVTDVHAGYSFKTSYGRTSFFAGISNLFDVNPPYIYSAALANSDPTAYDYLGRFVYGRITHQF